MKRNLFILLTLILRALLLGASRARDIFVPFVTGGESMRVASIAPYAEAPECLEHDPTKYHGLWNEIDGCHWAHTHNANPLAPEVVSLFGDYTEYTGQEVSYPWQTYAGAGPNLNPPPPNPVWELDAKGNGYKFDFYDFPPAEYGCPVAQTGTASVPKRG